MATTRTRVPPGGGGLGQPVRGVIGGAALHLPQQPLIPGQVKEAGMPPVGEQHVLPGFLIVPPPGPAAAVLIDPQVRHRRGRLLQHRARGGGERRMRHRPGDPALPRRLRHRPPALGASRPVLTQPLRHPAPRQHLRQRLGERTARAGRNPALPPPLHPHHADLVPAIANISRPVTTCSLTCSDAVSHTGHTRAPGSAVTSHTVRPPPGSSSTSATPAPSSANSRDAIS